MELNRSEGSGEFERDLGMGFICFDVVLTISYVLVTLIGLVEKRTFFFQFQYSLYTSVDERDQDGQGRTIPHSLWVPTCVSIRWSRNTWV